MIYLVTGCAGFIGRAVALKLLEQGNTVIGVDNLNSYYQPQLKKDRLFTIEKFPNFLFFECDIADYIKLEEIFTQFSVDKVIHLAAQAGVRYSISYPQAYTQSNLVGTANILELCRQFKVKHLVMASSSSVYGNKTETPFSENSHTDSPISYYAATKKANEVMGHSYCHLYQLPITALRFFTVYGPWGRPDMAVWLFTEAIEQGKEIKVFNNGQLWRDFTYIDDIVTGVIATADKPPVDKSVPFEIFNIGNHQPVLLETFITTLEKVLGKTANKIYLPMQAGDVLTTYADTEKLQQAVGFSPNTSLEEGLIQFVDWYRSYPQAI